MLQITFTRVRGKGKKVVSLNRALVCVHTRVSDICLFTSMSNGFSVTRRLRTENKMRLENDPNASRVKGQRSFIYIWCLHTDRLFYCIVECFLIIALDIFPLTTILDFNFI